MNILQINCVYKQGSTGNIVHDLHHQYLKQGIRSSVIYGRGKIIRSKGIKKVASEWACKLRSLLARLSGNLYGQWTPATGDICRLIQKENPDVVHIHCINGNFCNIYKLLTFLAKIRKPTVITHHAEFFFTGNCGYANDCDGWLSGCQNCPNVRHAISSYNIFAPQWNWKKMKYAFSQFSDNIYHVSVSPWLKGRVDKSPFFKGHKSTVIFNGITIDTCRKGHVSPELAHFLKHGRKIILHVTPYFEDTNKGGSWVIELAKRFINDDVIFLVAGHHARNHNTPNIHFLGPVNSKEELFYLYNIASVTLLTSKRETFSMVCAESLLNGTPVVGFNSGGPETIAIEEFSAFVTYGDLDALEMATRHTLKTQINKDIVKIKANQLYSSSRMAADYINLYKSII